jgi:CelD/BcsL family acetyltransferase involved in cellulose biosynthesis
VEPGVTEVPPAKDTAGGTSSASAARATLSVDLQRDLRLHPGDATILEALIAARPHVGVFLSNAWLSGFFSEPPAGSPALVLLRQAGVLRAVVPISIRQTLTHVHIGLLGGAWGSDRVDLIAARGFEAIAADTFFRWLHSTFHAFILELRDVPADSSLWGAVHRAGMEGRLPLTLQPREVHTLPYLDLTEPTVAPPPAGAHSLEKHRRWLERRCRLRIEQLGDPVEVTRAFESMRGFLHARWRNDESRSVLDDSRRRRFHQHVLPLLLAEGRLRMIRLLDDTRPIAVFYGLAVGTWWGYYLAGYDREWAGRIHLGRLTLNAAIEQATAAGATEFDFLKGADRVKYGWPVRERATLDADIYSGKSAAQFRRAARATRDVAAALSKSARGLLSSPGAHGAYSTLR